MKLFLKHKFEMKDLGELLYFLGIEVILFPSGVWLLQRQYGFHMLSKYEMIGCKPISFPLEQNVNLVYVSTKEWVANVFTKALCIEKLCKFRSMLGVLETDLSFRGIVEISSFTP